MNRSLAAALLLMLSPEAWAAEPFLSVTGLVSTPLHLSLAELRAFPAAHVTAFFNSV